MSRLYGPVTVEGLALPETVPYGTGGFDLFFVARSTEQRHFVARPSYGYESSTTYRLTAGSDAVDAALVPGVYDVVAQTDPELADKLQAQIAESVTKAEALQPPFDQEIVSEDGKARIQAVIDSLLAQEQLLQEVFLAYDFSVPQPE